MRETLVRVRYDVRLHWAPGPHRTVHAWCHECHLASVGDGFVRRDAAHIIGKRRNECGVAAWRQRSWRHRRLQARQPNEAEQRGELEPPAS
jgi:hypothetical protein